MPLILSDSSTFIRPQWTTQPMDPINNPSVDVTSLRETTILILEVLRANYLILDNLSWIGDTSLIGDDFPIGDTGSSSSGGGNTTSPYLTDSNYFTDSNYLSD